MMFRKLILLCFVSLAMMLFFPLLSLHAQKNKVRFPVWSFHDDSTTIVGLATGLITFGELNSRTYGLRIEVFGWGELVVNPGPDRNDNDTIAIREVKESISSNQAYGLNISGLGTICRSCDAHGININGGMAVLVKTYGISIGGIGNVSELMYGVQLSGIINGTGMMRGLQISPFNDAWFSSIGIQAGGRNTSKNHTGIQIGILNKTKKLKGLQLGIWNINEKRKLPIINWST